MMSRAIFPAMPPNVYCSERAGHPLDQIVHSQWRVAECRRYYPNMRAKGKLVASNRLARSLLVYCAIATLPLSGILHAQDFQYTITNGSITITNYIGPGGNLAIPATIDGLPVTAIGGQAFLWHPNLTAITIPDSVTNIEDGVLTKGGGVGAFSGCSALTNVIMGKGVAYIGMGSFSFCSSLLRISIPDSVTAVGQFAFYECESLTAATIGKSVTQVWPYAFGGCVRLSSVVIPGSVTNIWNYAFAGSSSLSSLLIEDGLASIGFNAFVDAGMINITLPATLGTLEDQAFAGCSNLAGVYFKGNAPTINLFPWGGGVFYDSSNVTAYYLPGTSGWGPTYGGRPAKLWNPQAQTTDGSFGVRQNQFGFNIAGTADIPLVVEATADLATTSWIALQTCTLTNGLLYFSDPQWKNYSERFYRIRSP